MIRVLPHYFIGEHCGIDQDWFPGFWMRIGGCGAVTACEICIYLARFRGRRELCPFDPKHITRADALAFGEIMRPYLHPRVSGIDKTEIFMDGFRAYLASRGTALTMESLEGDAPYAAAETAARTRIDRGMPVAYLMLLHRDKALDDYMWHWFVLNGYEDGPEGFRVRALTFGEEKWMDFAHLWDTRRSPRGGMVLIQE